MKAALSDLERGKALYPAYAPRLLAVGTTPSSATAPAAGPADRAVTLITGDRVVVAGRNYGVTARTVTFTAQMSGGRLLDVTRLLRWQYGDAATDEIP
ncbi:hypothetical protein [Nonomuraea jabiensis]|uniref:Uncharacterized protein n=1 Tax=Nonomuraea jabiensis TaxID=882448 RepID=A0A7W9G8R6_9ACTN|nr:hypothetical protein [Nonomuraea jabiensis]MBB5779266.1 hypothetical protein [Nonomuraea jabiensis]